MNPVDTFVRSGGFGTPTPRPLILGRDLVGVVESAPKFADFKPGDRVWANTLGHEARQGSFATRAVVPLDRLYEIPKNVEPTDIVALAHPATTAALAWFEHSNLTKQSRVFVGGACGKPARIDWAPLYTRDVTVAGFVHSRARADQMARAAQIVNRGASEGWLAPNSIEFSELGAAREAHERMESGKVRGRIVLRI